MKKITGKVVSLVLALALVVTSFSANFAFASTKKTLSGIVSDPDHDDIYLVNDSGHNDPVPLYNWLINGDFKLETKEHGDVTGYKIAAVSHVSGDKLVSADIDMDTSKADLKLKNKAGTEVLSVLYSGDYTDPDDDSDTEYTVKGRANLTVHSYNAGDIVFGEQKPANYVPGEGLDDFETFARNANATKVIGIYKAVQDAVSGTPLADFSKVKLTTAKDHFTGTSADTDVYSYELSSGTATGTADLHYTALPTTAADADTGSVNSEMNVKLGRGPTPTGSNPFVANADAKTGNVTITVKKVVSDDGNFKVSKDTDDKFTLKTKIEKKISVKDLPHYGAGVGYTIAKGNGSATNLAGAGDSVDAKDCEVVFPKGYTGDVSVGEKTNVAKISGELGTLKISDGKVTEVKLDQGAVDITGGKVGNVTTKNSDVTVSGDDTVVGNIEAKTTGDVKVTDGTVGDIKSKTPVEVTSNDEDVTVSVGTITAPAANITSDDAKLTIKGIVINADGNTSTIIGESKLSIASIDADYYTTEFAFGDANDDAFIGTIAAPKNAKNATISTDNEDTVMTMTGALSADTVDIGSDTSVTFTDAVTVKNVDGDGTMKIAAGKLYIKEGASGVTLKLSDATLAPGTTVFKADKDAVSVDDMDTFGFTLDVSTGNSVDTFKIKSISFAGIAINKDSAKIAKGYSETFTASAYPTGTALPTGATIKWELDGGSSDVFTLTTTGNTAKVTVNSLDPDFASENKTTLTATMYGEDGDVLDDYDAAKCDITALAVPEAASDTNKDFSVAKGSTYQFKITSATAPTFTVGTAGVFKVELASKNGNDYFYKITAIGNVGASTGVYLNGVKLLVASVKAPAFTTDTTKDATVKGSYQVKVTAAATPSFALGTAGAFKAEFVKKVGNDYFYKITSVGKAGAKTGVYVNGVKTFVATVG